MSQRAASGATASEPTNAELRACPDCPGIRLRPWSDKVFVLVCPCCSSRWRGSGAQIHEGSHNDYATYLCEATR